MGIIGTTTCNVFDEVENTESLRTDGRRSPDGQERPRHVFSSCELNHSKLDNFITAKKFSSFNFINAKKIISFLIWKWLVFISKSFVLIRRNFSFELLFANSLPSFAKVLRLFKFAFLSLRKIFVFFKKDYDVVVQFLERSISRILFFAKNNLNYAEFLVTSYCLLSVRLSMLMLPVFSTSDKTFGGGDFIFHISRKLLSALKNLILWFYACSGTILTKSGKKENQIVK